MDIIYIGRAKGENMANMYCEHEKEHLQAVARAKEHIFAGSDVEKICVVFRMLADPTRMKIVLALMQGEMCVYHLAEVANGTVSGVSHQLRVLRDNKIVKAKRFGKNVEYSIADNHVREIVKMGIEHLACSLGEEDA